MRWTTNRGTAILFGALACAASAAAVAAPKHPVPEELEGLALSGRALDMVADRIDPAKSLGTCAPEPDRYEIRVILPNVRNSQGNVRVSLYSGDKAEWMKGGKKLIRYDVPAVEGEMEICMPLPFGFGTYALALYHDEDADTDYDLSEGYGFSNDAKAGFLSPADFRDARFRASDDRTDLAITIRY